MSTATASDSFGIAPLADFWFGVRVGLTPMRDESGNFLAWTAFMTPAAVRGFDREALSFLTEEDLRRVEEARDSFLEIIHELPDPDAPATGEHAVRAVKPLREIGEVFGITTGRYRDPEAFRIGYQVDRQVVGRVPPVVDHNLIWYESDGDGYGGRVLVVNAPLADDRVNGRTPRELFERLGPVNRLFESAGRAIAPEWLVRVDPRDPTGDGAIGDAPTASEPAAAA